MTQHKEDYSWVYIGLAVLIGGAILYFLFFSSASGYVKVKYRDDKVNISSSNFEPLDKSDSTVKGAGTTAETSTLSSDWVGHIIITAVCRVVYGKA